MRRFVFVSALFALALCAGGASAHPFGAGPAPRVHEVRMPRQMAERYRPGDDGGARRVVERAAAPRERARAELPRPAVSRPAMPARVSPKHSADLGRPGDQAASRPSTGVTSGAAVRTQAADGKTTCGGTKCNGGREIPTHIGTTASPADGKGLDLRQKLEIERILAMIKGFISKATHAEGR